MHSEDSHLKFKEFTKQFRIIGILSTLDLASSIIYWIYIKNNNSLYNILILTLFINPLIGTIIFMKFACKLKKLD